MEDSDRKSALPADLEGQLDGITEFHQRMMPLLTDFFDEFTPYSIRAVRKGTETKARVYVKEGNEFYIDTYVWNKISEADESKGQEARFGVSFGELREGDREPWKRDHLELSARIMREPEEYYVLLMQSTADVSVNARAAFATAYMNPIFQGKPLEPSTK